MHDAVHHFAALRVGPLAADPELHWAWARAQFEAGEFAAVAAALVALAQQRAAFRVDEAFQRYGTFEGHAENAIWVQSGIDRLTRVSRPQRELNPEPMRRPPGALTGV